MEMYSISELNNMTKQEHQEILNNRGKVFVSLVSKVLSNNEIQAWDENFDKWRARNEKDSSYERKTKSFNIKEVTYEKDTGVFFQDNRSFININIHLENYNSTNKKESIFDDDEIERTISEIAETFIGKNTRLIFNKKSLQGKNYISMEIRVNSSMIAPDMIFLNKYKEETKKTKVEKKKESILNKLEEQLQLDIKELMWKRFNLIRETHLYIPSDKKELMEYIKRNTTIATSDKVALKGVIERHNDNEKIVVAALSMFNDELFQYASDRLKNDKEFILKVIDKNYKPMSLINIVEHIAPHLQDDDDIMTKAINVSGYIIRAASDRIKNDKNYCMTAVANQEYAYGEISEEMKLDKDILLKVMETRGDWLAFHPEVKTNKELLIKAFSTSPDRDSQNLLKNTSEELRNDKEVALAAIKCYPKNIDNISKELKEEIGDNDPIQYLTRVELNKKLNNEVPDMQKPNKVKIKV